MNILSSSGLAVFITSIITAAFVYFKNPKREVNIVWGLFCLSVAAWAFGLFMAFLTPNSGVTLFWSRFLNLSAIFIPIFFIHFVYAFLGTTEVRKRFLISFYVITFVYFLAALLFPSQFVSGVSPKAPFLYYPDAGWLYFFFPILYSIITIFGIVDLFAAYRRAGGQRRNQINYLFWGMAVGFVSGATTFPYVFDINIYPFGTWGVIFYVLMVAYAITKLRLLDISIVISRAVAEVVTIIYLATIYLVMIWLYRTYVSILIDIPFIVGTMLFGILVGQIHQKTRISVQTSADKLFLRGKYDYYTELSDASAKVVEKLSLTSILGILYETFQDVIEVANPLIYLTDNFADPKKESNRYLHYDKDANKLDKAISLDDALITELISKRSIIIDHHNLRRELVIPCLLEGRLISFFVLPRKISEDHYTDEDIRLLKVLASQAAVALDHTRSYKKIKRELELIERQLFRSQSLASLGTLTAGVTHEIRNPLAIIRAETERLANKPRDLEYLHKYQILLLKYIDRIEGIIQRMLGLAKEREREEKDVNLNDVINNAMQLINFNGVELKKEYGEIHSVKGVPEELEEVFINLIQNAIESMQGRGIITIKTYPVEARVVVMISDTGKGIPDDIQAKIFDPFFSTRHEGVGLGLSIAYRIIREHGGDIEIDSKVGKGTTFKLEF
jgi:signal transduction histidine kinase